MAVITFCAVGDVFDTGSFNCTLSICCIWFLDPGGYNHNFTIQNLPVDRSPLQRTTFTVAGAAVSLHLWCLCLSWIYGPLTLLCSRNNNNNNNIYFLQSGCHPVAVNLKFQSLHKTMWNLPQPLYHYQKKLSCYTDRGNNYAVLMPMASTVWGMLRYIHRNVLDLLPYSPDFSVCDLHVLPTSRKCY